VTFKASVLTLVARIPRGRVATYGQLAALAGKPRSARAVGQVMSRADGVPWHRVVNSQGGISRRSRMTGMVTQRIRLEQEGVVFRRGRVALSRFRWHGGAARRRHVVRDAGFRDSPTARRASDLEKLRVRLPGGST
jgi:methylated-DNA-protein-cysteine methyltransferase related protein